MITASLAKLAMPVIPTSSKPHAKAKAKGKHLAVSLLVQELARGRSPSIPPVPNILLLQWQIAPVMERAHRISQLYPLETCVTPVKSVASSSSMSPDMMQFLATLHGAKQTGGHSVAARLEAKRKEREDHRVVAKTIAKDLKKLRQAKSLSHKKTKGCVCCGAPSSTFRPCCCRGEKNSCFSREQ